MKHALHLSLILTAILAFSCATPETGPPVTDSSYFNGKMDTLASDLTASASRRIRRAAILDFVNSNGRTSQLGRYLTNKFTETAVKNNLFDVPLEGQVSKTLKDQKLDYKGTLDTESVQKLGGALRVDTLVMGMISDLQKGSDIDLVVKMVDVRTGQVISAASASFYRSKQVSSLLGSF